MSKGKVQSVRYSMLTSMLLRTEKQRIEMPATAPGVEGTRDDNARQANGAQGQQERETAMKTTFEHRLSRLEQTMIAEHEGSEVQAAFK